ncbi:hypothetical protein GCM10022240_16030 [Microbacterium kribbense]|uniref:Uncharacterized protein n=1 Tax=Microbacterium kribbense TaxID=433645 RepID=A0ABP7GHX5_9MICO
MSWMPSSSPTLGTTTATFTGRDVVLTIPVSGAPDTQVVATLGTDIQQSLTTDGSGSGRVVISSTRQKLLSSTLLSVQ